MSYRVLTGFLVASSLVGLAACGGGQEVKLTGMRESIIATRPALRPDVRLTDETVQLPEPTAMAEWTQAEGVANHEPGHIQLPERVTEAFRTKVMSSLDDERIQVTTPVTGGGLLFVNTPDNNVVAINAVTGKKVWRQELAEDSDSDIAVSGGLAYGGGKLYATTASGQVVALDAASGKKIWTRDVGAPVRAAPTLSENRLFIVTHDNRLHVLDAKTGGLLWTHSGIEEGLSLIGGAAPAVANGVVVVAYSSGEIYALRVTDGRYIWHDMLASRTNADPFASLSDIAASPVIAGKVVYALNLSGQMVVFNLENGQRLWARDVASASTPLVAGNHAFIVTDTNKLVAINRRAGGIKWVMDLGQHSIDDEDEPVRWYGPVLAGDRLMLVSSDGYAASINPYQGKRLSLVKLADGISVPPIVSGQRLYFLTDSGRVIAYQ